MITKTKTNLLEKIFYDIMPKYGYYVRKNQVELAEEILKSIQGKKISLCEAGVGIGKTHAYIIAAIVNREMSKNSMWQEDHVKKPIVISTSSIALQKAILNDYIPEISRILFENKIIDNPLSAVIRKGKEHYICDLKLVDCISGMTTKVDQDEYEPLLELKNLSFKEINLDNLNQLSSFVKRKIRVSSNCNPMCRFYEKCRFNEFMKYARSSQHDFQICNHNYMFADTLRRKENQLPLIPNYSITIIDEAHKLVDVARQMYGTKVTSLEVRPLVMQVSQISFRNQKHSEQLVSLIKELHRKVQFLFKGLLESIPKEQLNCDDEVFRYKTEIGQSQLLMIKNIAFTIESFFTIIDQSRVNFKLQERKLSYVKKQLRKLKKNLLIFFKTEEIVYWLETEGELKASSKINLCCIPKVLDKLMYENFWSRDKPTILTSGTLAANHNFDLFKNKLGLSYVDKARLTGTVKESPFDYQENCLLYLSESVPFPNGKDVNYIEAVMNEIEKLIIATNGHTMVLFTSYQVMERVYRKLQSRIKDYPFFKVGKGMHHTINEFKKSGNGVLFATGSCWEGIDIAGDILSSLIIVKLPFAVPDPISEFEATLYSDFKEYKVAVIVPEMLIKLKQGVGRLIRSEKDTGVISILDSRMTSNLYKNAVLEALPDCQKTNDISDVEKFISDKKDVGYFMKVSKEDLK